MMNNQVVWEIATILEVTAQLMRTTALPLAVIALLCTFVFTDAKIDLWPHQMILSKPLRMADVALRPHGKYIVDYAMLPDEQCEDIDSSNWFYPYVARIKLGYISPWAKPWR